MRLRAPVADPGHEDILELEPLLRRVVGARVRDPDTVDDLVQEALARVIAVRGRLDDEAIAPYAIVTARNLVTSLFREEERSRRHRPRLVDPGEPERPEEAALRREEAEAVEAALAGLPEHERETVVAHEVEGVDTATLAEARRSTPGAVGTQLARTRARLRLDYLLALRRVDRLPTARCRPVLLALSAGDRRRQLALDAGGHLMQCPTCASLSRPLVERRRSIAVLLPLVALWWLWRRFAAWARRKPVLASLTAVSAVTVASLVLVPPLVERAQAPRPAPTTTALPPGGSGQGAAGGGGGSGVRLIVPGRSLLPVPGREVLARHAGQRVRGVNVPTRGVYADEGFWVGTGRGDQLWVQLIGRGESPFRVRPGQRASFTGRLVPSPPGFAKRVGMRPAEGAALSGQQAFHIEVAYGDITLEP
jgi:RNA polymerase sigma factor (sigma-70 family)